MSFQPQGCKPALSNVSPASRRLRRNHLAVPSPARLRPGTRGGRAPSQTRLPPLSPVCARRSRGEVAGNALCHARQAWKPLTGSPVRETQCMEPPSERFIVIRHHSEGLVPLTLLLSPLEYQLCNGTGLMQLCCRQRACGRPGLLNCVLGAGRRTRTPFVCKR